MRKLLLAVIFLILLAYLIVDLGANVNIDKEFKLYIVNRISRILNMEVSAKKVRFGLVNNLIIDNVCVRRKSSRFAFSAGFDKVIIRYKLWDMVLRKFDSPQIVIISKGKLRWRDEITGVAVEKENVYGTVRFSDVANYKVELRSGQSYLYGRIDPPNDAFNLSLSFSQGIEEEDDFLLTVDGQLAKQISKPLDCNLLINAESRCLRVAFNLKGGLEKSWLEGNFNFLDRMTVPFKGKLSIGQTITFLLGDGSEDPKLVLSGKFLKPDFEIDLKLNHINFKTLDVVSEFNLSGKLKTAERSFIITEGRINSQNLILDYKPFQELDCCYRVQSDVLEVLSLSFGENLALSGRVSLKFPYIIDLRLTVAAENLDELSPFICPDRNVFTARKVKADFRLLGPLSNPEVKGRFESKKGFLIKLGNYESINVNLNGNAKFLAIDESRIYKQEGSFIMGGEINFEKENILEGVTVMAESGALVWSGWEVTRKWQSDQIQLGKNIGEDFRINFKTYINEERQFDNQLELEYILSDKKSLKMQMKEDENFLGLEHKFKF
ncbi:MAG: hypothetical protein U9Q08_02990 [Candidatus Omnitrophota bacterium]|nr:hypothetical protein [Candidatus Omnitrophota bacterium]